MKKIQTLLWILVCGLGLRAQRAEGQTIAQTLTFSIICQYRTNTYTTTNHSTQVITQYYAVDTALLTSANLVKAMLIDTFWTNNSTTWQSNFMRWRPSTIVYEEDLNTGYQGIFLRYMGRQMDVTSFFTNSFNSPSNMFSQNANTALVGTNYAADALPLGAYDFELDPDTATNTANVYDNLAYLTFASSNSAFTLFGYSQGKLVVAAYDKEAHGAKVDQAQVVGAGTFTVNLTTNFLRLANPFTAYANQPNRTVTATVITNATPPVNYNGIAHGTVNAAAPYHLDIDIAPPEGSSDGPPEIP